MKALHWAVIALLAGSIMACRQAPPPAPKAAADPGKVLTADEVDKLEQEKERRGMRAPDAQKMQRDAARMEEKGAARAEAERKRLTTEAEKAER